MKNYDADSIVSDGQSVIPAGSDVVSAAGANGGQAVAAHGAAVGTAAALPCLDSDNCIKKCRNPSPSKVRLTPSQKKIRHKLILAIEWMVRKHGIERVGVLTESFGVPGSGKGSYATWALRQKAKHLDFVQERWHSLCTNVIAVRYEDWICVFEMHGDRVWHIHIVVATKEDIRTGTDIKTLSNYNLPYWMRRGKHLRNEALAKEWRELRVISCKYRFGRVELLPIKKTAEAVGHYLGDYLVKTYNTLAGGKRCRLIRFSKNIGQAIGSKFAINSVGTLIHRTRLRIAARMLRLTDYGDFADYFGPQWHCFLKNDLVWIPVPFHFTKEQFLNGFAASLLREYADNPKIFLEKKDQVKIDQVSWNLWRKLREALEENQEGRLKYQASYMSDNFGDAPLTAADMQDDLFDSPDNPF